jgi:hypothetical protein
VPQLSRISQCRRHRLVNGSTTARSAGKGAQRFRGPARLLRSAFASCGQHVRFSAAHSDATAKSLPQNPPRVASLRTVTFHALRLLKPALAPGETRCRCLREKEGVELAPQASTPSRRSCSSSSRTRYPLPRRRNAGEPGWYAMVSDGNGGYYRFQLRKRRGRDQSMYIGVGLLGLILLIVLLVILL